MEPSQPAQLLGLDLGWWILAVALLTLAAGVWVAIVTHLLWRRPTTHMVFLDDWEIDSYSNLNFGVVEVLAAIAPGGAIMVAHAKAWLSKSWWRRRILLPNQIDQKNVPLDGARRLGFSFILGNEYLPLHDDWKIIVEIRLKDGAKAKFKQRIGTARM